MPVDLAVTPAAEAVVETEAVTAEAVGLKSTDPRPERIIESSLKICLHAFLGRFVSYSLKGFLAL